MIAALTSGNGALHTCARALPATTAHSSTMTPVTYLAIGFMFSSLPVMFSQRQRRDGSELRRPLIERIYGAGISFPILFHHPRRRLRDRLGLAVSKSEAIAP